MHLPLSYITMDHVDAGQWKIKLQGYVIIFITFVIVQNYFSTFHKNNCSTSQPPYFTEAKNYTSSSYWLSSSPGGSGPISAGHGATVLCFYAAGWRPAERGGVFTRRTQHFKAWTTEGDID